MSMNRCPACGHTHEGPGLAGICIGCPCPVRPEQPRLLDAHQIDHLCRILATLSGDATLSGEQRDAYAHALRMVDELLAEAVVEA